MVDDSRAMRKIIRNALEDMGYSAASVIEASDGVEAMAKLRECLFKIDIILADWNMPGMDGLALLKQLQGMEHLKRIPFIIIAGEAQRGRVVEAVRAGARNYLVKPFTLEALRREVLAIERELLARRNPSDTAVIRFEAANVTERHDPELPFLAQLPTDLVGQICASASVSEHERGKVLVEPADVVQSLHIVDTGEVEILPSGDGRFSEVCGHGDCFGELSFLTGDPAGLSARAGTDVAIASVGKSEFADLLAKWPHLSFYLMRLLAKRARKADTELTTELEKGLSGRLSTMAFADLVQTLHNGRKTGLLRVCQDRALQRCAGQANRSAAGTEQAGPLEAGFIPSGGDALRQAQDAAVVSLSNGGDGEGEIYFIDGNVRQAQTGAERGEEAFYRLMTWAEGSFTFETGGRPIEPVIFRPTPGLLMEGMRRQDERRRKRA